MLSLWLPLWSLIGPDEGFVFLILVFTFFITISIIVKFRSHSAMDAQNRIHYVAQETMALTKNPFQFRLTPPGRQQNSESSSDAEENQTFDDEVDEGELNKKSAASDEQVSANDGDKRAAANGETDEIKETKKDECKPSTSREEPPADDQSDFRRGIKIDVFCKSNFYLCYFWGVNIDQFHNFMRLNSQSFNDRLIDGTLFDQAYLERNTPKLENGTDKARTFQLTCSEKVNPETLGQSPRACYPLVVILARDLANEADGEQAADDVVFMINVIHVKDKVCPLDTNVITRLLKKRNGLTINLQTLYTPNEFDDETSPNNTAICVICQEEMVSIALLPCRHTCTCLECFTKITLCPLCRSYIRSYFVLKIEENPNNQTDQNNQADEQETSSTNGPQDAQPKSQPARQSGGLLRKFKNLFKSQ